MSLATDIRYAVDPVAWCKDKFDFHPDQWQEEILLSNKRRFLLLCCRQSGKSTITSLLSLHTAMYNPGCLILIASPTERQSKLLFKKIKDFYKRLPDQPPLTEDNKTSMILNNDSWIQAVPGSHENIRGFSAPILVVEDEAAQCSDELFTALNPMVSTNNGKIMLLSTPYGRRGHFFETYNNSEADWERIKVTADDCARISPEYLTEQRKIMVEMDYKSEFFCSFEDNINSVFSSDLIMAACCDDIEPLLPGRAYAARYNEPVKPWIEEAVV